MRSPKSYSASVVLRGKNEIEWLKRIVPLLRSQTIKLEIIYIDNDSTDGSIVYMQKEVSDVKIESLKVFRPGKALNLGVARASGDYCLFLSSHCLPVDEFWAENSIAGLIKNSCQVGYGRQLPHLAYTPPRDARDFYYCFKSDSFIQKKSIFFHNANSIIKTSLLRSKPFSEDVPHVEDLYWSAEYLRNGGAIYYNADVPVLHYHGISRSDYSKRFFYIHRVFKELIMQEPYGEIFSCDVLSKFLALASRRLEKLVVIHPSFDDEIDAITRSIDQIEEGIKLEVLSFQDVSLSFSDMDISDLIKIAADRHANDYGFLLYINPEHVNFNIENLKALLRKYINSGSSTMFFVEQTFESVGFSGVDGFRLKKDLLVPRFLRNPNYVCRFGAGFITSISAVKSGKFLDEDIYPIDINEVENEL